MSVETVNKFLDYLRFEKRSSPHTVTSYQTDLDQFFEFLNLTYQINDIKEVNHLIIRSWIVKLMENDVGARSVNRKVTCLRSFYKFLVRQNLVSASPMAKIQSPKIPKRLTQFVEKAGMDTLLDTVEFGDGFEGVRNKLIIEMFYATGMRLAELIGLENKNVDLKELQIKVLGKRNKERLIPITLQLKEQISNYLLLRNSIEVVDKSCFFVTEKGNKLYEKLVYGIVNSYLSMVTTIEKKSPHVLRHTFATHMLNSGADINAIKELLGHANLSATQVYTHNTVEKLKNVHKQAHPKA